MNILIEEQSKINKNVRYLNIEKINLKKKHMIIRISETIVLFQK